MDSYYTDKYHADHPLGADDTRIYYADEADAVIAELVELLEDCKTWIDNTDFIKEIDEAINKHKQGE